MGANNPRFFITHSWRDNKFARRLTDDLKAKGLHGFFDVYSIQPGDNIPSRISQGLEDCDVYIPILSDAAFSSPWCEWELGAALQLRNTRGRMGRPKIIPVLIDHCEDKVPAILRPVAYVNFSDNYTSALRQLLVRGMGVGIKPPVLPESKRVSVPPKPKSANAFPVSKGLMVTGIILVFVAVIILATLFLGGYSFDFIPLTLPPQTSTSTVTVARATLASSSSSLPVSPTTSPATLLLTPPASIDRPLCPEPDFTNIIFPTNGISVTGEVQVRGTVKVHPFAQPYLYSLFYRPGIVHDNMDSDANAQAPRDETSANGINVPIRVLEVPPFADGITNGLLGNWDTAKLKNGWYSLRLWNTDRGGNYMGCDVYVYVKGQ